jgi:hypothetical protein
MKTIVRLPLLLAGLGGVSVLSGQVQLVEPPYRGDTGTFHSAWADFAGTADVAPDRAGSFGRISELTGTSTVTGSQNIYNAALASRFTLDFTAPSAADFLLLQVVTQGTELDYGSVALSYEDPVAGPTSLPYDVTASLGSEALGGFGGSKVGTAFEWDLSGLDLEELSLGFQAAGAHLSLDEVVLDYGTSPSLSPIPEPSTYACIVALAGLAGVLLRRRWRRFPHRFPFP